MKSRLIKSISLILAMLLLLSCLVSCKTTDKNGELDGTVSSLEPTSSENGEGGGLGAAGTRVSTYGGLLGYGYNLLEKAYFNYGDTAKGDFIIDMDALARDGYVYVDKDQGSRVQAFTYIANSTKEYSEQISAAANVDVKVGLTGSFQSSFKMKHTSEINSNEVLITNQSKLCKQQEYIGGISNKELAGYTTSIFRDDAENKTPEVFIKKYGTHILKNIDLGGRFELNYVYTNKMEKTTREIEASVAAANAWASGDVSGSQDTQSKELSDNSQMYIKTYGGPVTVNTTSIEQARSSYPEWAKGIQEGKQITFIDCTENIPIWDIVKEMEFPNAKDKANEIKTYFDSRADEINAGFKKSVAVTTKVPTKIYIHSLHLGIGSKQHQAKNQLRDAGVLEANIIDLDLNDDTGGNWVYLGYKTTTDPAQAVTGLVADYYSKSNSDRKLNQINYNGISYQKIPGDINDDAGGKFIHLYYTKDSKAGQPITGLKYQRNGKFQYGNADSFEAIRCRDGGGVMDFNYTAGGASINLWVTRK